MQRSKNWVLSVYDLQQHFQRDEGIINISSIIVAGGKAETGRVRQKSSKQSHLVRGMMERLGMEVVWKGGCGKGKQKKSSLHHMNVRLCVFPDLQFIRPPGGYCSFLPPHTTLVASAPVLPSTGQHCQQLITSALGGCSHLPSQAVSPRFSLPTPFFT